MRVIGAVMGGVAGECALVVSLAGPRPLARFPLTLALSHEGRGDCCCWFGGVVGRWLFGSCGAPCHSECGFPMSFRVQRGISPLPRWERVRVRVIGAVMGGVAGECALVVSSISFNRSTMPPKMCELQLTPKA